MEEKKLISVIVPCYNEQDVLPMFYKEITKVSAEMQEKHPELEFEYLFIDDGSKDRTLRTLRVMAKYDKRVRYISFSRNFGKESGIYAGLQNAKGDYCVVMDADLQHPPAFLPKMYEAVASGLYDCATTRRVSRAGESKIRSWFARMFYKIMNMISQTEIVDGAQDFRFMTRQMVDAVLSMTEYNRFSKGIFSWVGFRVKYFEYENVERAAGKTTWSFFGLFRYSLEGIIGFSTAPLSISAIIGLISCLIGIIMLIVTVIKKLVVGDPVAGYPTMICTILLFGGLQLFCTGILGLYLGKTYLEVKKRPVYLTRETEKDAERMLDLADSVDTAALEAAEEAADETEPEPLIQSRDVETADAEFDAIAASAFAEAEAEHAMQEQAEAQEKAEAERAAREQEAAERAAREQEAAERAAREQEAAERAAREQEAAERAAREQEAAERAAREQEAAERAAREQEAAERAAREQEAAERAAREQEADDAAAEPAPAPKSKFEVKIDYDKNNYDDEDYDDEDYDDDEYDDEYDDDDYDDEYDDYDDEYDDYDDYDDEPEDVPPSLIVSWADRLSEMWANFKKKIKDSWEKLAAEREAAMREEAEQAAAEEAERAEAEAAGETADAVENGSDAQTGADSGDAQSQAKTDDDDTYHGAHF